jgi:hypothetical protein
MSDRTYVFEPASGQMDAATAALLSNRNNNGGLFGSNGLEGLIGLIIAAGIFGGGNGNGWFGGGGNNNAEREMLMQAISRNGNDINSLAQQYNCSTGQVMAAINALATQLSTFSGQQGMTSMQIINALQQGNATLASQLCDCCCKTQSAIQESNYLTERGFCNTNQILSRGFSDLGYATRDQTCSIEKAIAGSTAEILAGQRAAELRDLQNKLETEREKVSQQATAINNYQQTQTFAAMLQPISASLAGLHSEVDGIKCKLPKTETIVATPDYVPINRGINVNYAPYSCLGGFGFPYGFNNGNGSFF